MKQMLQQQLNDIREALVLDNRVIRSMTLNFRAMVDQFDQAVDHARTFFDDDAKRLTDAFHAFKPSTKRMRRKPRLTARNYKYLTQEKYKKYKGFIGKQFGISGKLQTDKREKEARKALMSRQQAALSLVRLRDLAQYNSRYSPTKKRSARATRESTKKALAGRQPREVFVDGSRVSIGVQDALWSMLSEPEFRGDDGGVSKVLSVGVPAGFTDRLEDSDRLEESDRQDSRTDRQLDMVTVDVFRKDIIEEDIVFKPKQYIFEMSRFVSAFSGNQSDWPEKQNEARNPQARQS